MTTSIPSIDIAPASVRRILVCQLRQIGDVLLATPSIKLLAEQFPQAEIHVFTEKKCTPMLENNPHVAKVWAIDKKQLTNPFKEMSFYWEVARQGYDIVIDFQQLPRCRWVVALSGARVRLSYTPEWYNKWMFTHTIKPLEGYSGMAKASVLRPLGIEWQGEKPELHFSDEEKRWAASYLAELGVTNEHTLFTIDPTHRRATRMWPAKQYGRLISLINAARPDARFMLLFGPGEEEDARAVVKHVEQPENVLIPERILTLREMAACIAEAAMHVGNCSSPRHIAVASGTPTFTVLGATSPAWTFPSDEHTQIARGLDCQPCNRNSCDIDYACLEGLSAETVWEALQRHMLTCSI